MSRVEKVGMVILVIMSMIGFGLVAYSLQDSGAAAPAVIFAPSITPAPSPSPADTSTPSPTETYIPHLKPKNCKTAVAYGLTARQSALEGLDGDSDGVACYGD